MAAHLLYLLKTEFRMESPSYSKQGDLFISPCNFSEALFPVHRSPYDWRSCNDAYTYSWTKDFKKELTALSSLDLVKMINSMGFCPQNRCQLFNLSSTGADGMSPEGLCYTKVENGGLSYGACAFHGGLFNSGVLLGYYYKIQPTPKPIYKKSRIVLGNKRGVVSSADDSTDNFINANQIYPGLIGTQCPLASRPSGFNNTVDDVKRMIVENNITLWVQLAPGGLENFFANGTYIPGDANCGVFALEFFSDSSSLYSKGVSEFKIAEVNPSNPYVEMTYTVTAYSSLKKDGTTETTFEDMSINRSLRSAKHSTLIDGNSPDDSPLPTVATDDEINPGFFSEIGPILLDDLVEVPLLVTDKESNNAQSILSPKLNKITFEEIPLTWKKVTVNVKHVWYHKWKDFRTPPPEDQQVANISQYLALHFHFKFISIHSEFIQIAHLYFILQYFTYFLVALVYK